MIGRRMVVLGSAFALSGCATRTLESCDPHTGGPLDYLACRDRYADRYRNKVDQLLSDEQSYRAAEAERQRLEGALASLTQELKATNARLAALRSSRDALERRLSYLQDDAQAMRLFLPDVRTFVDELGAANLHVADYRVPTLAGYRELEGLPGRFYPNQKRATEVTAKLRLDWNELAAIWIKFGAHLVASEAVKGVIEKLLAEAALEGFIPIVGEIAIAHTAWELVEAVRDSYNSATGG